MNEIEWREALYRQLARQAGLPAGLRPELIKRAESCVSRLHLTPPAYSPPRQGVEGCKGAISR
jgi:hypothetical protein